MPFTIIRADITKLECDAIVNAANKRLAMGGGVCGAIFSAAGKEKLSKACAKIGFCQTGCAVITKGFGLKAKYIIHTVGPIYGRDPELEEKQLYSCYQSSLTLAKSKKIRSIAFPLISSGTYHYPKDKALSVATRAIKDFLSENEMDIYLTVYDKESFQIGKERFSRIKSLIDEKTAEYQPPRIAFEFGEARFDLPKEPILEKTTIRQFPGNKIEGGVKNPHKLKVSRRVCDEESDEHLPAADQSTPPTDNKRENDAASRQIEYNKAGAPKPCGSAKPAPSFAYSGKAFDGAQRSLADIVNRKAETFSEMLLRLIDEKGMTDVEVYKRANIDRKLFSKIRKKDYTPKKSTVIALIIALRLNMDEAEDLLKRAGFAFSECAKFDIIVSYFIENSIYDIFEINETLFAFDEQLLGA